MAALTLVAAARPEGMVLGFFSLGLILAAGCLRRRRTGGFPDRAWIICAAVWIAQIALYLLWKWSYFGYLLPNPYYVKAHNLIYGIGGPTLPGLRDTVAFFRVYGPAMLCLAVIIGLSRTLRRNWVWLLPALLPPLAVVLLYARAIHEVAYGHRYEYPFLIYGVAACAGAAALLLARMRHPRLALPAVPVLLLLAYLLPLGYGPREPLLWMRWKVENTSLGALSQAADDLQRTQLGPRASILLSAAGIIPYVSGFRALDWVGLNNNYLSGRYPLTMDQVWGYIDSWRPDVVASSLPPASPGATDHEREPVFYSQALLGAVSSTPLFMTWDGNLIEEMFFREMCYLRDRYTFGACYAIGEKSYFILYVRRDSPYRDLLLAVLRNSYAADRATDLQPIFGNDPRLL